MSSYGTVFVIDVPEGVEVSVPDEVRESLEIGYRAVAPDGRRRIVAWVNAVGLVDTILEMVRLPAKAGSPSPRTTTSSVRAGWWRAQPRAPSRLFSAATSSMPIPQTRTRWRERSPTSAQTHAVRTCPDLPRPRQRPGSSLCRSNR